MFYDMSRFTPYQIEVLKSNGFTNFYELRNGDGASFTIEPRVYVNNIGCIATNFEIEFEDKTDPFITDSDFFKKYKPVENYIELMR